MNPDPGWMPAVRRYPWRGQGLETEPAIIHLRFLFLAFVSAVLLIPAVLAIADPFSSATATTDGWLTQWRAVAIVGVVSLAALAATTIVGQQRWTVGDDQAAIQRFQGTTFVRVALAETPIFVGFVLFAILGDATPFLIGLGTSLLLLAVAAPTEAAVTHRHEDLAMAGSPVDLRRALYTPRPAEGDFGPNPGP